MAGTERKRIIELTEASTVQSGDFIAVDSNARGTKKVPTSALATSAALTAETNARTGADEQMSERMDGIEERTALIQNPTKTLSGALCSFADGADMPMVACTAEIVPKQSGTGTPSPDNVRPISGWDDVSVYVSPTNDIADATTTTTSLGRTVYGGTLDVVSGELTVTYGIVDIGTLDWRDYTAGSNHVFAVTIADKAYTWNFISSVFPNVEKIRTNLEDNEMGCYNAGALTTVCIRADAYNSDANAFKTAMSGQTICYELATPQTYQLTPTEVKTLLGENNVWADSGDVEITYRRDISIVINNLESALNG